MKNKIQWILLCLLATGSACNAVDRADIACMNDTRVTSDALLRDCQAGAQIAEDVALAFARSHRLLPIASIPDNDEIQGAKSEAYSQCVLHVKTPEDWALETQRQMACEAGIEAYIRQIEYYNRALGQGHE
jgi:hypothetical protein